MLRSGSGRHGSNSRLRDRNTATVYFKSSKRIKQGQQEDIFNPPLTFLFVCLPSFEVFFGVIYSHCELAPADIKPRHANEQKFASPRLICMFCHQQFSLKNLKSFLIKCLRFSGTTSPSPRYDDYGSPGSDQSALHHGSLC